MKKRFLLVFLSIALCTNVNLYAQIASKYKLSSPDKKTGFEIGLSPQKKLYYRINFEGKILLDWSALGFTLNDNQAGTNTEVLGLEQTPVSAGFDWPLGENDHVDNRYVDFTISCKSGAFNYNILGRMYDATVAFRYSFTAPFGSILKKENTLFQFPSAYTIYQYHHESAYTPGSIDTFNTASDFPSTLSNGNKYVMIGEAMNDAYTKAELKRGEASHSLAITFARDSAVEVGGEFKTPWRTVSVSNTAIGLHAFSELNLKLNPPPADGIPSWIKPGKLFRSALSTRSGIDCIDFAAAHKFQYIMFDAGWYGAEFRGSSDPAVVIPELDMQKVIDYGKQKGIGVIQYVNYVGLRAKLDEIIPLYQKWGVKGLKFGFVDGVTQKGIKWLDTAIAKINKAGFILDIHDNYKPTGLTRKYPALLTQEGIRGDENSPDAFHTTTLPFTRFLAGAADFTFCYPNASNRYTKNLKVSMAQQLALTVIYFSPLQSMFWYGVPTEYTNESEIEFFSLVPTVWNESIYLAGDIGKGISTARRSGKTWFIGNAAGLEDWNSQIKFDFLQKGKNYTVTLYEDDGRESIRKRSFQVKKGDTFKVELKAKSGQAMMLTEN